MQAITNQSLLKGFCESSATSLAVENPATGEIIAHVPTHDISQIETGIERSYEAQKTWQAQPAKVRSEILMRWYQSMMDNQNDLARLITLEQGKPLKEAMTEVTYGAAFVQWFAEEAKRAYGETIPAPSTDRRIVTIKQPVGVTCAITPWNFPLAMITRKAAPALAAGCSLIVKPAESTPLSAFALAELAYQAGINPDLLQVVCNHAPSQVGQVFTNNSRIRKVSFTGSTAIGRTLMAQCASTIKRTSMELGGNAPFIVFDDADIDQAIEGALAAKFRNTGQACICANRFYVHDSVYETFIAGFAQRMQALKVGNGLDADTDLGPIIHQQAKTRILNLVERACEQGATVIAGGQTLPGSFVAPTLLGDVTQDMDIIREEIFGPIAPVLRFQDDKQLIQMANDTIHGLGAYFYSPNVQRIWPVAEALNYGMIGINSGAISAESTPFGGVKQSGVGREGARQGLEEYMDIKALHFGGIHTKL